MTATPTFMSFENQSVRFVIIDGEPWWAGKDVCACLEIENSSDALNRLENDERRGSVIPTPSGDQTAIVINEPGVYRLIFTSRKPAAERFKRWLAHDVLPELRRTGRYVMVDDADGPVQPNAYPDIEKTRTELALVRETRKLHGTAEARLLWDRLDLPRSDIFGTTCARKPITPEEKVLTAIERWDAGEGLTRHDVCIRAKGMSPDRRRLALHRLEGERLIRRERRDWTDHGRQTDRFFAIRTAQGDAA